MKDILTILASGYSLCRWAGRRERKRSEPFLEEERLELPEGPIPVRFRHYARARRYILRLDREGNISVTLPPGGSLTHARQFLHSRRDWIILHRKRFVEHAQERKQAQMKQLVWFRGKHQLATKVVLKGQPIWKIGEMTFPRMARKGGGRSFREEMEAILRPFAAEELHQRTRELAAQHKISICRVTVRNQRSCWGSCSASGTISLNWRLVQTPLYVRDYIILHELMHVGEMNHSSRFWRAVENVCPRWRQAETWLKKHGNLLLE